MSQADLNLVFIIGDHRSGTTVLYQTLSQTDAFDVVTAYHVICNDSIVPNFTAGRQAEAQQALAERFNSLGLTNRGIDGVRVTPDLPEEYGFIIDPSSRPHLSARTLPAFVDLCRRLQLTGRGKPLLLKNPWDVLSFVFVKQAFPRAKFVFVHRHPLNVMHSQLAAIRSLLAARNEYVALLSPWYRSLFDHPLQLRIARLIHNERFGPLIVNHHVSKVAQYYLDHIATIPREDFVEVRYEDLCTAPDATIGRILEFIGVDASSGGKAHDLIQPRKSTILTEVRRRYDRGDEAIAAYRARQGYPVEL